MGKFTRDIFEKIRGLKIVAYILLSGLLLALLCASCGEIAEKPTETEERVIDLANKDNNGNKEKTGKKENKEHMTVSEIKEAIEAPYYTEAEAQKASKENLTLEKVEEKIGEMESEEIADSNSDADSESQAIQDHTSEASYDRTQQEDEAEEQIEYPKKETPYIEPGWLYKGSVANAPIEGVYRETIDQMVEEWTQGKYDDNEFPMVLHEYLLEEGLTEQMSFYMGAMGSGNSRFLVDANHMPNFSDSVNGTRGYYRFYAVYTKGEYTEYGYLICYDWGITI